MRQLAELSGVADSTIRYIEKQEGVPSTNAQYLAEIQKVFAERDIEFGYGERDSVSWPTKR